MTTAKFLDFLTSPAPLSEFYVLFVCKFEVFFDPPLPPLCGRHIWNDEKEKTVWRETANFLAVADAASYKHA